MANLRADDLRGYVAKLRDHAVQGERPEIVEPVRKVEEAAATVAKAWSGSNMGYQSRVYYTNMQVPLPGAHFDSEWGFLGQFQGNALGEARPETAASKASTTSPT